MPVQYSIASCGDKLTVNSLHYRPRGEVLDDRVLNSSYIITKLNEILVCKTLCRFLVVVRTSRVVVAASITKKYALPTAHTVSSTLL